jgi:hypothetical protein
MSTPPEFQIERDYDNRMAHARSMFHMAVQRAESELDAALSDAMGIRDAELKAARRDSLSAASEEVRTELATLALGLPGVGVTRLTKIRG